jgi:hypothetical protein
MDQFLELDVLILLQFIKTTCTSLVDTLERFITMICGDTILVSFAFCSFSNEFFLATQTWEDLTPKITGNQLFISMIYVM